MAKTTALANYDKELAALAAMGAKTAAARAGTTAKTIGTSGAHFTIDGKLLKETTLDVVITDFILVNAFYTPGEKYDPKNPASPICYAYAREDGDMAAHADSLKPQGGEKYEPKGGEPGRACADCWANQWQSADKGKGKACKNGTRLGLITADSIKSAESIDKAEIRFLSVPPTSGPGWAKHTDAVQETFNLPVLGVVTQVEIGPMEGGGHQLDFSVIQEVDRKVIGALLKKHEATAKDIDYPFFKADEAPAAKGAKPGPRAVPTKQPARASSKGMGAALAGAGARTTKY